MDGESIFILISKSYEYFSFFSRQSVIRKSKCNFYALLCSRIKVSYFSYIFFFWRTALKIFYIYDCVTFAKRKLLIRAVTRNIFRSNMNFSAKFCVTVEKKFFSQVSIFKIFNINTQLKINVSYCTVWENPWLKFKNFS